MDFVLSSTAKAMGEHRVNCGSETFLDLDYVDDLSILDDYVSKRNEFFEVLRPKNYRIILEV